VLSFAGELDAADTAWLDELDAVLDSGDDRIVLDFTDVSFVDSSVVQSLVAAHNRVGQDGWVRIVYTHHLIKRVIEICGLAHAFPQYTSVDAALRAAPVRGTSTVRGAQPGGRT